MSQVLYLKWRPLNWDQVVSQEHVITTLRNAVRRGRVSHAQLFSGPRGTGKTTTARILAKAVNCLAEDVADRPCNQCAHCRAVNQGEFLDLIEIDAASNTSVEDVRDLRDKINFSPNQGRYKVYIIDEVHMLSTAAFNALLKTLEEPPEHAIFVLATTEVHKIPATVLSRCQRHEFRRIPVQDIVDQLNKLVESEGLEVDPQALGLIARQATGSMRDAISILDQLASLERRISLNLVHSVLGTSADQAVLDLLDALLAGQAGKGLNLLQETLERGSNPRQFGRQFISYLRSVLLVKMGSEDQVEQPAELEDDLRRHSSALGVGQLLELIKVFNQAVGSQQSSWLPMLPLEMAFVEALGTLQKQMTPAGGKPEAPGPTDSADQASFGSSGRAQSADGAGKESETRPAGSGGAPVAEAAGGGTSRRETPPAEAPPTEESPTEQARVSVLKAWSQIIHQVRGSNPTTQALLNTCQPLGVKEGVLVLSFRSEINKQKMEKEDHLQVCQQVIREVVGTAIPVRCVLGSGEDQDLPDQVDPDGLVATAVRDLGGRYVSDQEG